MSYFIIIIIPFIPWIGVAHGAVEGTARNQILAPL